MALPPLPGRTRVLVVDDHPAIREALAWMIQNASDLELVGQAGTADAAFALVKTERPDVVVVDVAMPDTHGLDFVRSLLSIYSELGVVVYSVYDEMIYAERALRAGALGYVMKRESSRVVQEAIRSVARGEAYLSRAMSSRIVTQAAGKRSRVPGALTDLLTDREVAVLQLVGEGCDLDEIASRLHITRKTAETHRRHVKEKLELHSIPELLVFAVRWAET